MSERPKHTATPRRWLVDGITLAVLQTKQVKWVFYLIILSSLSRYFHRFFIFFLLFFQRDTARVLSFHFFCSAAFVNTLECHESSSHSWAIDCRNPLIARLSTSSSVKTRVFVCRCYPTALHLRSSAAGRCGRPVFPLGYSLSIILSALTVWRATLLFAWLPVCFLFFFPVGLWHLCVLVVSWHGWPMSLWVIAEPGLKYSSAVSAAGFVTTGDDIWVTRAWTKWGVNKMNVKERCWCEMSQH